MLEVKQYHDIKKGVRYIPFDTNTNSKIYKNGLELIKIPKPHIPVGKTLENLIRYIDSCKMNRCIKVKSLIYKQEKCVAYSIKFYKGYKSLRKLLSRNFELKKQDCLKIEEAFNELSKNNLEIIDYNLSNILCKNDNVLICDLDGLILNQNPEVNSINNRNLFVLILAYLYRIPTNQICALIRHIDNFLIEDNQKLFDLFSRIKEGKIVNAQELLNLITDVDVKVMRRKLKLSISNLQDSGYYKNY